MGKRIRSSLLALGAAMLAACGGGQLGGGTTGGPPPPPTPVAASLSMVPVTASMPSTADNAASDDAVTLTVIARDANNNVVANVPVAFGSTSGALVVLDTFTDSSGQAQVLVHTGGDPTLRTITVTAAAPSATGTVTASSTVQVVTPTTNPPPSSLTLLTSSPQLSSNASDPSNGVTVSAIVKDASNNIIEGVLVQFTTTDPGANIIVQDGGLTDENGTATAIVTTSDPRNRVITINARAASITASTIIRVIGTTLSISGPDATQISTPTDYVIQLNDSGGDGIAGATVTVSTNPGNTVRDQDSGTTGTTIDVVTDGGGQATVTLNATVGASFVRAQALGITFQKSITVSTDQFTFLTPAPETEINIGTSRIVTVQWLRSGAPVPDGTPISFAITRGTVSTTTVLTSGGTGRASITISSTESGFATIVASSTALSRPSASLLVEFVAVTPFRIDVQANPSNIATNQSTDVTVVVRDVDNNLVKNVTVDFSLDDSTAGVLSQPTAVTNSQGLAVVRYTASSQTSATRSVLVTGKVRGSTGTVAGQSCPEICDTAAITVGASAVSINIGGGSEIIRPNESSYQAPFTVVVTDSSNNPVPDAEFRLSAVAVAYIKGTFNSTNAICPNEDVNLNDLLDPSEDVDGDGLLDPGRVASVDATVDLDEQGSGQFVLTYAQDHGLFVFMDIIGVASVAGSETTVKHRVLLPVAADDVPNLPGVSPYGTAPDCTNPN